MPMYVLFLTHSLRTRIPTSSSSSVRWKKTIPVNGSFITRLVLQPPAGPIRVQNVYECGWRRVEAIQRVKGVLEWNQYRVPRHMASCPAHKPSMKHRGGLLPLFSQGYCGFRWTYPSPFAFYDLKPCCKTFRHAVSLDEHGANSRRTYLYGQTNSVEQVLSVTDQKLQKRRITPSKKKTSGWHPQWEGIHQDSAFTFAGWVSPTHTDISFLNQNRPNSNILVVGWRSALLRQKKTDLMHLKKDSIFWTCSNFTAAFG